MARPVVDAPGPISCDLVLGPADKCEPTGSQVVAQARRLHQTTKRPYQLGGARTKARRSDARSPTLASARVASRAKNPTVSPSIMALPLPPSSVAGPHKEAILARPPLRDPNTSRPKPIVNPKPLPADLRAQKKIAIGWPAVPLIPAPNAEQGPLRGRAPTIPRARTDQTGATLRRPKRTRRDGPPKPRG